MLYMKEDDMDEMMRRAAENYEVDAGKAADWNAVYKAVHEQNPTIEEKKKKRRFAFWWLLLIPLGWIANTEYNKFQNNHTKQAGATVEVKKAEAPKSAEDATSLKNNITVTENNTDADKTAAGNTTASQKPANSSSVAPSAPDYKLSTFTANRNRQQSYNLTPGSSQPQVNDATTQQQPTPNGVTSPAGESLNNNDGGNTPVDNSANKAAAGLIATNTTKTDPGQATTNPNSDQTVKQNEVAANSNNKTAEKSSLKNISRSSHYFYIGLMAGADLSFVKYQNVEPLGYNVGLLAGYKFKKLSIESGFYFVKKNYYTSGEHFDKSSIPYFDDAEILTVNGYCNMFEIPLNVKYDFSSRKKHTWFAAAGLSSYLMNKEYYNYDYIKDGMEHNGSRGYKHTTQDWFSVLNLSAGYELRTGNKTNIRIEPYYKTTLTGVGTGSLSISSVGINAGIIRKIP